MRKYKDINKSTTSVRGNLIVTEAYKNSGGSVHKCAWDQNYKLNNLVRFTGPAAEDGKSVMPYRCSADPFDYNGFMHCVPIFQGGSFKNYSFVAAYQDPNMPDDYLDTDKYLTPAQIFLITVRRMMKSDIRLQQELQAQSGRSLAPRIKHYGLVQGYFFARGDKNYQTDPLGPCVIMLSWSAKQALEQVLNEEVADYNGDPEDYQQRFAAGDILDADHGKLLNFYNARAADLNPTASFDPAGGNSAAWGQSQNKQQGGGPNQSTTLAHYTCDVVSEQPLPRMPDGTLMHYARNTLFTSWDKVINFLSEEDMVKTIIDAYSDKPQLILAAFSSRYNHLIPKTMRGEAVVTNPGMPGGGAPQQVQNWGVSPVDGSSSEPASAAALSQAMAASANQIPITDPNAVASTGAQAPAQNGWGSAPAQAQQSQPAQQPQNQPQPAQQAPVTTAGAAPIQAQQPQGQPQTAQQVPATNMSWGAVPIQAQQPQGQPQAAQQPQGQPQAAQQPQGQPQAAQQPQGQPQAAQQPQGQPQASQAAPQAAPQNQNVERTAEALKTLESLSAKPEAQ